MLQGNAFISSLRKEMQKGLPGWDAQMLMSARGRLRIPESVIEGKKPRQSSVLVWLFPQAGSIFTRLILRTEYEGVHSGQVAFPGGAMEESDSDLWQTALREAREEVGLPTDQITQVGELSPLYIPPSNFRVQPFLGASAAYFPPIIDPAEVQRAIDFNIFHLLDPALKMQKALQRGKPPAEQATPGYNIQGHFVWGATAMILSELEELAGRVRKR